MFFDTGESDRESLIIVFLCMMKRSQALIDSDWLTIIHAEGTWRGFQTSLCEDLEILVCQTIVPTWDSMRQDSKVLQTWCFEDCAWVALKFWALRSWPWSKWSVTQLKGTSYGLGSSVSVARSLLAKSKGLGSLRTKPWTRAARAWLVLSTLGAGICALKHKYLRRFVKCLPDISDIIPDTTDITVFNTPLSYHTRWQMAVWPLHDEVQWRDRACAPKISTAPPTLLAWVPTSCVPTSCCWQRSLEDFQLRTTSRARAEKTHGHVLESDLWDEDGSG